MSFFFLKTKKVFVIIDKNYTAFYFLINITFRVVDKHGKILKSLFTAVLSLY